MSEDWFVKLKQNFQDVIEDEEYIAHYLETYKKRYRLGDQDIQNLLKIGKEQYFSLGLCKIPIWNKEPKTAEERFANQVKLIAKYIECDPLTLENFLSNKKKEINEIEVFQVVDCLGGEIGQVIEFKNNRPWGNFVKVKIVRNPLLNKLGEIVEFKPENLSLNKDIIRMSKFLNYQIIENTGKTLVVGVMSNVGDKLGIIKWKAQWRRYVLFPFDDIIFDVDCLEDIIIVIKKLMKNRK